MRVVIQLIVPSNKYKVYAVGNEVEVFILEQQCRAPVETRKLLRLIDHSSQQGPPRNKEKCRSLEDGLFEFKAGSLRLIWFWDADSVILCTHGFVKKCQKAPRKEIERAQNIRASYEEAKRAGQLIIKE